MDLPSCPRCGTLDFSVDADLTRPVWARLHDEELTLYTNSYRPDARRLLPHGYLFCTKCRQPLFPTPTFNPYALGGLLISSVRDERVPDPPRWEWEFHYELDDPQPDDYNGMQEWFREWYGPKR